MHYCEEDYLLQERWGEYYFDLHLKLLRVFYNNRGELITLM